MQESELTADHQALAFDLMQEACRRGDGVYAVIIDPNAKRSPVLRMVTPLTPSAAKRFASADAGIAETPSATRRPREHRPSRAHKARPPNDDERPRPCACGCGCEIPAGSRAHRKTFDASCRKRLDRARDVVVEPELLELFTLAREAIAEGADPALTLSLVLWPPESGDDARALLGTALRRFPNSRRALRGAAAA